MGVASNTASRVAGDGRGSALGRDLLLLYERNPFRILDLAPDATTAQISKAAELKRMRAKLAARANGQVAEASSEVDGAVHTLRDPHKRIRAELFSLDIPDAERKAIDHAGGLQRVFEGARPSVALRYEAQAAKGDAYRKAQNVAILSHAEAIAREFSGPAATGEARDDGEVQRLWASAYKAWSFIFSSDVFWRRVRDRITSLAASDPRIRVADVARLQAELPAEILRPNAELAARALQAGDGARADRLLGILRASGFAASHVASAVERAYGTPVSAILSHVETAEKDLEALLSEKGGNAKKATAAEFETLFERFLAAARSPLDTLAALKSDAPRPVSDARDRVAEYLRGLSVVCYNHSSACSVSQRILDEAKKHACSDSVHQKIKANQTQLNDNLHWVRCWYCEDRDRVDSKSIEVVLYKISGRTTGGVSFGTVTLKVPRCAECAAVHDKGAEGCVLALLIGIPIALLVSWMGNRLAGGGSTGVTVLACALSVVAAAIANAVVRGKHGPKVKASGSWSAWPPYKDLLAEGHKPGREPSQEEVNAYCNSHSDLSDLLRRYR